MRFVRSLGLLLLVALGFAAFNGYNLYKNQEKMIFMAKKVPASNALFFHDPFEEITLTPEPGVSLSGVLFKSTTGESKGLILYFHGRGLDIQRFWGYRAKEFTSRGYDFMIFDYRQMGKSVGPLSEKAVLADCEAIYTHALSLYPEEKVVIYGSSLGTGPATFVASNHQPKMLLLEAPYINFVAASTAAAASVGKGHIPTAFIEMMVNYRFPSDEWIQKVSAPTVIFHGTKDEVIPYAHGQKLALLAQNATLVTLEDQVHDTVHCNPQYRAKLDEIL